jgi:hypothetical protein
MPIEDYLALLARIAPAAHDGARAYRQAWQQRCGRSLTTAELRVAMAVGDGNPVLMGMIRASHLRDLRHSPASRPRSTARGVPDEPGRRVVALVAALSDRRWHGRRGRPRHHRADLRDRRAASAGLHRAAPAREGTQRRVAAARGGGAARGMDTVRQPPPSKACAPPSDRAPSTSIRASHSTATSPTRRGELLFAAGTRKNPLEVVSLSRHLLFFDARDPRQVKHARELSGRYAGRIKPILTGGSYLDLMKAWRVPVYYDQPAR